MSSSFYTLLYYEAAQKEEKMERKINVIEDLDGKKTVFIHDIVFISGINAFFIYYVFFYFSS